MLRLLFVLAIGPAVPAACSAGDEFSSTGGTSGSGGKGGADGPASGGSGGSGKILGSPCNSGSECASGTCADDVCCDSTCNGTCETCKSPVKPGQCAPIASGLDPDGECKGAGTLSDPCAGRCNGDGACLYPDGSKACGPTTCSGTTQTGKICDGTGACIDSSSGCAPYLCGLSSCTTSCSHDTDCDPSAWCNVPNCEVKKPDGEPCQNAGQCANGICADGFCCATQCAFPFTCATGTCLCGTIQCAAGELCIDWYRDADGDGFGATSNTQKGCTSSGPSGYVKKNGDCLDTDNNVFPGQPAYFGTPRSDGVSFDYNCDNQQTSSELSIDPNSCTVCNCSTTDCAVNGTFGCNPSSCSASKLAFPGDVPCGKVANLYECVGSRDAISGFCKATRTDRGQTVRKCH